MKTIIPSEVSVPELHQYILGSVAPRPIAFASTINAEGKANLAPYSFFNAFSSHPPTLIFSSNRRVKGNTTKDTLHNVEETGEVVINIVTYDMVRQMALASIDYPADVDEFEKSGFTPIPSEMVKPFRVKESPMQFECKVKQVLKLGEEGGAANLIICEIVRIHLAEHIFDENGKIDPQKTDQVARMGRAFYCRAHGENIFKIYQPFNVLGIGFDNLPESVRQSKILTGNELGELAAVEALPSEKEIKEKARDGVVKEILHRYCDDDAKCIEKLHYYAKELIAEGKVMDAWKVLLQKV